MGWALRWSPCLGYRAALAEARPLIPAMLSADVAGCLPTAMVIQIVPASSALLTPPTRTEEAVDNVIEYGHESL